MPFTRLRIPLVVAAVATLTTSCWGGTNAASTAGSVTATSTAAATTSTTTAPLLQLPPAVRLTVRYAVGYGDRPGRCPRGAVCRTHRIHGSNLRTRVARFTLSCDPPGGTYPNPRTACAAAASYVKLSSRPRHGFCMCPLELYRDTITGTFRGTYIDLPIDPCTLCGMGRDAHHDAAVLVPTG
jgi:hypothetical protein